MTEGPKTRDNRLRLSVAFAGVAEAIRYVEVMALALYQAQGGVIVPPLDAAAWARDRSGVHAHWYAHAYRTVQLMHYRAPELLPLGCDRRVAIAHLR